MTEPRKIRRALISLSDKTGAVEFAKTLAEFGVSIISTGGTAKTLRENGIDVNEVADITGFSEMMDGRVKTLHPKIHGAFLALRDNAEHVASMKEHGIEPIDQALQFAQRLHDLGVRSIEGVELVKGDWRNEAITASRGGR